MEVKKLKISELYYQYYFSFNSSDINNLIQAIKDTFSDLTKEDKTNIIRELLINDGPNVFKKSIFDHFKESINALEDKEKTDFLHSDLIDVAKNKIDTIISDYIVEDGLIIVSPRIVKYIGDIKENKPLVVSVSLCAIDNDYNLNVPNVKFISPTIRKEDINELISDILVYNGYYNIKIVSKVTRYSDVIADIIIYNNDGSIKKVLNEKYDVNDLCESYELPYGVLDGLGKDEEYKKEFDYGVLQIKCSQICDKVPLELNDTIVNKLNFYGINNVIDFSNKIYKIYSFMQKVTISVMETIANINKLNKYPIDDNVINHYKKCLTNISEEDIENNCGSFFTDALIINQCTLVPNLYYDEIKEEYDLLKFVHSREYKIDTFDNYYYLRSPIISIYEYFEEIGLI